LGGPGYLWLTEWSDNFACNRLDVADVKAEACVPDSTWTLALLGCAFGAMMMFRRRLA
jgi:hypothetical protein